MKNGADMSFSANLSGTKICLFLSPFKKRVDLLSVDTRKAHAAIWNQCYAELGKDDIAKYMRLTALVNGKSPQGSL